MEFESLITDKNIEALALKHAYGRSIAARAKKITEYPYQSMSVIIPSRLDRNPVGKLWLEDAVASIYNQNIRYNLGIEIIVGVDEDAEILDLPNIKFVRSKGKSQACALNAAIEIAQGEVIAFLEDDDVWGPRKIDEGMIALNTFDFVSSNQMEFILDSNGLKLYQRINEYPTPSGWMMPRELFNQIGVFDESYKYHLDSEWLGRLNKSDMNRCHMVEKNCPSDSIHSIIIHRMRLSHIMNISNLGSCIWNTNEEYPLVYRATHVGSGMNKISTDREANKISMEEHRRIYEVNKINPW